MNTIGTSSLAPGEELCFNLWYYLYPDRTIYMLAARVYALRGSDEQKSATLCELSKSDWRISISWPVSKEVLDEYGHPVDYSALRDVGIERLYAELFKILADDLPSAQSFPDEKLYFATPLFDFGYGYVPAEIGDGFVRERDSR